ncbi:hypothetical protein KXJ69_05935 [Aureisphaera sp. CAU 1614]|uniref:Uncharacterized protein n=1 Tax=Halomarinibacterium sedimenti TaxID=2857106 RepID=A0A9X1JYL3_9FLAO|nr:hypothetical protein [Halomarinibacterium sedimenti]MBW2937637.1 hypothetical protein [Halomarinibacterium sedimenti]
MANQTYQLLFQIGLFHTYFESGSSENAIDLIIENQTQRLFERYGFVLQKKDSVFFLYHTHEGSLSDYLNEIEVASNRNFFEFKMVVKDDSFFGYTELPVDKQFTYLYESDNYRNSEILEDVILEPTETPANTHFGEIKIYFKDIVASTLVVPRFDIQFKARATRWDYYIINTRDMNLETLSIETNEDFQFLGPEQVTIANGQGALKLTSGHILLPLSSKSKYTFNLITIYNGDQKSVIGLPHANPDNLQTYQENGIIKFSSPMYIYI